MTLQYLDLEIVRVKWMPAHLLFVCLGYHKRYIRYRNHLYYSVFLLPKLRAKIAKIPLTLVIISRAQRKSYGKIEEFVFMVVLSLYSTYESNSTSFTSNVFSVDEIHHNYPISTTSKWIWKQQQHVITRWTTFFPYEKMQRIYS